MCIQRTKGDGGVPFMFYLFSPDAIWLNDHSFSKIIEVLISPHRATIGNIFLCIYM